MYGTIYFLDGRVAACWPNGERITSFHHLRLICIDSLTHDAEKKGWCFYHNWFKIEWKIDFSKYYRLIIYILEISGMLRHLNTSELLDKIWAALANILQLHVVFSSVFNSSWGTRKKLEFLTRNRGKFEESFYPKIAPNYYKQCTNFPLKKYHMSSTYL